MTLSSGFEGVTWSGAKSSCGLVHKTYIRLVISQVLCAMWVMNLKSVEVPEAGAWQ